MHRAAFTLIELMVCLVLLGLIAGAAALMLRGPQRMLRTEDVLEQLAMQDRLARRHARRHDVAVQLVFDLDAQRLRRRQPGHGPAAAADQPAPWPMPGDYRIERMQVAGAGPIERRTALAVSRRGQSVSYAVAVRAPGAESLEWLMVVGLTGQIRRVNDIEQFQAYLGLPEQERHARNWLH